MKIGCPKETKDHEYRVGLSLSSVVELVRQGHQLFIESGAGLGVGTSDSDYHSAGATIVSSAEETFAISQLLVKVKEPNAAERRRLQPQHTLFTYLHLAADKQQALDLIDSQATCVAYETVTDDQNRLPLLFPMSEIAGRLSVQAGATHLEKHRGGRGVLLAGASGVAPAKVVIIGGGVVGSNALSIAKGMGACVYVLDKSTARLKELEAQYGDSVTTVLATPASIEEHVITADLVVGAVLTTGGAANKVLPSSLVKKMLPGAVIADVAIDQGGCCENSRPTTHTNPTFVVDDVVHYCVSNIPGAVPITATDALNRVTLPYILELANKGIARALLESEGLRHGLNVFQGAITHSSVAEDLQLSCLTQDAVKRKLEERLSLD